MSNSDKTEYNRVMERRRNDKWHPKGNLLVFVMVPFFPLNVGILLCLFVYLFLFDSYFVILTANCLHSQFFRKLNKLFGVICRAAILESLSGLPCQFIHAR